MSTKDPTIHAAAKHQHIGAQETLAWAHAVLKPGSSILDVGCGKGILAKYLMESGFKVLGIDHNEDAVTETQKLGVPAQCSTFLSYETEEKFDALVFSRSLHHMLPVEDTVRRARELLKDDGLLLVEDFGADLLDLKTALWFFGLKATIEANCETVHGHGPQLEDGRIPSDPLCSWRDHHFGKHDVADFEALTTSIGKYFEIVTEERLPYLYRYFLDDVNPQQGRKILDWEIALCHAGALIPIGLRCLAKPRART